MVTIHGVIFYSDRKIWGSKFQYWQSFMNTNGSKLDRQATESMLQLATNSLQLFYQLGEFLPSPSTWFELVIHRLWIIVESSYLKRLYIVFKLIRTAGLKCIQTSESVYFKSELERCSRTSYSDVSSNIVRSRTVFVSSVPLSVKWRKWHGLYVFILNNTYPSDSFKTI